MGNSEHVVTGSSFLKWTQIVVIQESPVFTFHLASFRSAVFEREAYCLIVRKDTN